MGAAPTTDAWYYPLIAVPKLGTSAGSRVAVSIIGGQGHKLRIVVATQYSTRRWGLRHGDQAYSCAIVTQRNRIPGADCPHARGAGRDVLIGGTLDHG